MAVKRGVDGQPNPKNQIIWSLDPIPTKNIWNPFHGDHKGKKLKKKAKQTKKKEKKKNDLRSRVIGSGIIDRYDVVSALTNARSGLPFGRLRRSEAVNARKTLAKSFGKGKLKVGVVEVNDSKAKRDGTEEKKCLAVALVKLEATQDADIWTAGLWRHA